MAKRGTVYRLFLVSFLTAFFVLVFFFFTDFFAPALGFFDVLFNDFPILLKHSFCNPASILRKMDNSFRSELLIVSNSCLVGFFKFIWPTPKWTILTSGGTEFLVKV